jgi:hypothetical protein
VWKRFVVESFFLKNCPYFHVPNSSFANTTWTPLCLRL